MKRMRQGLHVDFIGRARFWFILSAILILASGASLLFRGFNAGLEFRGGTALQVESGREGVDVTDVRDAFADIGIDQATIQGLGDRGFLVQTTFLGEGEQGEASRALADAAGVDVGEVNVTEVGPKWGAQITGSAVRALIIFFVVAVLYLSIRLEPKMAAAAMAALFHDISITAGVYSVTGFEVTPATVIALLTVMGYSLYDTVVIFDRVKDRTSVLSASGKVTYSQAANGALNQVLVRSVATSVTSLLPIGSLLFVGSFLLGAQTLRELALALFIGIIAGTYSSLFVATPLLAVWKEREERWATLRTRIAARGGETLTVVAPPPPPPPPVAPAGQSPAPEPASPSSQGSPSPAKSKPALPVQRRRKRKRRR